MNYDDFKNTWINTQRSLMEAANQQASVQEAAPVLAAIGAAARPILVNAGRQAAANLAGKAVNKAFDSLTSSKDKEEINENEGVAQQGARTLDRPTRQILNNWQNEPVEALQAALELAATTEATVADIGRKALSMIMNSLDKATQQELMNAYNKADDILENVTNTRRSLSKDKPVSSNISNQLVNDMKIAAQNAQAIIDAYGSGDDEGLSEGFLKDKVAPLAVAGAIAASSAFGKGPSQETNDALASFTKEVILVAGLPKDSYRDLALQLQSSDIGTKGKDIKNGKVQRQAFAQMKQVFSEKGDKASIKKIEQVEKDFY